MERSTGAIFFVEVKLMDEMGVEIPRVTGQYAGPR
jgi:hypothetical protein